MSPRVNAQSNNSGHSFNLLNCKTSPATLAKFMTRRWTRFFPLWAAHRASILLFDKEKVMRFVAWRGLSEKYRKAVEGHSPWKSDAKNPKPVCINDADIADILKPLKSAIRSEGIRAAAFIPLVSSRKLIGKFMTYYDAPHVFTDDELKPGDHDCHSTCAGD